MRSERSVEEIIEGLKEEEKRLLNELLQSAGRLGCSTSPTANLCREIELAAIKNVMIAIKYLLKEIA